MLSMSGAEEIAFSQTLLPLALLDVWALVCGLGWWLMGSTTRVIRVIDSQTGAEDKPSQAVGIIIELC